ncbi:phosphoserine phosphatase [Hahella sp. CCB-MM4]|uniref:histidinol-phosphatase n=1 Tax=Hahella sp. (strain CCB-MM4) TaxID=1926491 RepID=UPI000B9A9BCF|nr:HAD family hydrolase [Hahella sp. CCB-MM4]OZG71421.1 phosphoserine phosphatase [Hahella sp. CCB-MM4]
MALAIFDLDNTLIAGDSDHTWGDFLIKLGVVDKDEHKATNDQFYEDYLRGELDIFSYIRFATRPLTCHPLPQLHDWREQFIRDAISPMMLPKATNLLQKHRDQGDFLLIITATNRFVTEPIAELLGVDDLIATELEMRDGAYTGEVEGTPSYQEGKVTRLGQWLQQRPFDLSDAYFYSDSHNDIPLLDKVGNPIVVDGDRQLLEYAERNNWPTMSLR